MKEGGKEEWGEGEWVGGREEGSVDGREGGRETM